MDVELELPDGRMIRERKTSPVNTRRGAEQYERDLRTSTLNGTHGKEAKQIPTVAEYAERFMTYADNNKPSTVDAKNSALNHHILPYFGATRLNAIGLAEVEDFKAAMRQKASLANAPKVGASKWAIKKRYGRPGKALSPKTINNVLGTLRRMLSLAHEQGVIPHMPKIKQLRTDKAPFDFLDFDEAERLVSAADGSWRTLIMLALKSGLRRGELIGLQWGDLDLVRGKLHVRRTIWRGQPGLPKGGRARIVDLPASVVGIRCTNHVSRADARQSKLVA